MAYRDFAGELDDPKDARWRDFSGELDEAPAGRFKAFTGELDAPDTPARRHGGTRAEAQAAIDDNYGRGKGGQAEADPRRLDRQQPTMPEVISDASLQRARRATQDPLLNPDYVTRLREDFAKTPEDERLPELRRMAGQSDVQGRAARQILGEVEAENRAVRDTAAQSPELVDALARAPRTEQPARIGAAPRRAQPTTMPEVNELTRMARGETVDDARGRDKAARALSDANSSPRAMADRAEFADRDFSAEAFAKEYPKLAALASGGGTMVAGLLNSVPTVMDYAARLIDKDATRAPNALGVDDLLRTSKSLMPAIGRQDMDKAWDKGEFGGWLSTNLIAQAPQMAGSVLAAFFPPLRATLLPAMGAQQAGQSFAEGDSSLGAVLKGAAEVVGEKASLGMFDRMQSALAKLPPPLRGTVLASLGKSLPLRAGAVTAQGVTGAVEEVVTQVLQNGVDRYAEGKNVDLLDKVGTAAVLGAFMEGPMAVPHALRNIAPHSAERQVADAINANVAGTEFDRGAVDGYARRAATDPNFFTPGVIDPRQTVRALDAIGPSAPVSIDSSSMPDKPFTPDEGAALRQAADDEHRALGVEPGERPATLGAASSSQSVDADRGAGGHRPMTIDAPPEPQPQVGARAADTTSSQDELARVGITRVSQGSLADQAEQLLKKSALETGNDRAPDLPGQLPERGSDVRRGVDERGLDGAGRALDAAGRPGAAPGRTQPGDGAPVPVRVSTYREALSDADTPAKDLLTNAEQPAVDRASAALVRDLSAGPAGPAGQGDPRGAGATPAATERPDADLLARHRQSRLDFATKRDAEARVEAERARQLAIAGTPDAIVSAKAVRNGAARLTAEAAQARLDAAHIRDARGHEGLPGFTRLAQAVQEQFGRRVVAYVDERGDQASDGFTDPTDSGTLFVNLASPHQSVHFTVFHELQHAIRAEAARGDAHAQNATKMLDQVWGMISQEGKANYAGKYLFGKQVAGRQMTLDQALASPLLRDEMLSDFMGKRAEDPKFWGSLATQHPQQFGGFVQRWVSALSGLIKSLRGTATDASIKNIDPYIAGLERAEGVARTVMRAWADANPQLAARQGIKAEPTQVAVPSGQVLDSARGVALEVAPHPDQEIAKRWRSLTAEARHAVTKDVMDDAFPRVMAAMGWPKATYELGSGMFEGEVNPNITLDLPTATHEQIDEAARAFGYVFDQKAMVTFDENDRTGGDQAGFVKVIPRAGMSTTEVESLRRAIAAAVPQAGGDTARDGAIIYGNFSGLSDAEFERAIYDAVNALPGEFAGTKTSQIERYRSGYIQPDSRDGYLEGTRFGQRHQVQARPSNDGQLLRGIGQGDDLHRSPIAAIGERAVARRERLIAHHERGGLAGRAGSLPAHRNAAVGPRPQAHYGRAIDGAVSVDAFHFSRAARSSLSTAAFGSGLRGSGHDVFIRAADKRLAQRLHFYFNRGEGIHPEAGVGGALHRVELRNLYDVDADPLGLRKQGPMTLEAQSKILDLGFDGFMVRGHNQSGLAVVLGRHEVPVESLGQQAGAFDGGVVADPYRGNIWYSRREGAEPDSGDNAAAGRTNSGDNTTTERADQGHKESREAARLNGLRLRLEMSVDDAGAPGVMTVDAGRLIGGYDERIATLKELVGCLGK